MQTTISFTGDGIREEQTRQCTLLIKYSEDKWCFVLDTELEFILRDFIYTLYFTKILECFEILQHIAFYSLLNRLNFVLIILLMVIMLIMRNIKELILRIHILLT